MLAKIGATVEISNSYICDNSAKAYGAISIDVKGDSSKTTILNSTIAGNSSSPAAVNVFNRRSPSSEFNIVNSIFWNGGREISLGPTGWPPDVFTKFNLVYSRIRVSDFTNDQYGRVYWHEGNMESDPMIFRQTSGIYALQNISPCIDKGVAYYELDGNILANLSSDEYIGSAPDIGAYEYGSPTGISDENYTTHRFSLQQNYPNPFNPSTIIKYSIPKQSNVTLKIFDVLGSEVETLVNTEQPQGNYEVDFDGNELTSGIYFYKLQAGDFVETKKMILLK